MKTIVLEKLQQKWPSKWNCQIRRLRQVILSRYQFQMKSPAIIATGMMLHVTSKRFPDNSNIIIYQSQNEGWLITWFVAKGKESSITLYTKTFIHQAVLGRFPSLSRNIRYKWKKIFSVLINKPGSLEERTMALKSYTLKSYL